jgi:hypothetical protein
VLAVVAAASGYGHLVLFCHQLGYWWLIFIDLHLLDRWQLAAQRRGGRR